MPSASCDTLLDDIEDIVSQEDSKPQDRHFARKHVVPKVRRRNTQKYLQEENSPPSDSTIPGIQKIWIRTWGCSHNNSDGEYMAGQLAAYGYKITENASDADLWLLNSCTVKNPAEDHFRNSIKKAQEENKKVVLAGCVPQAQPHQDYLKGLSIIGVQQIDRVVEVVEETIKVVQCTICFAGTLIDKLAMVKQGPAQKDQLEYSLTRGLRHNCLVSIFDPYWASSYLFLDGGLDMQPLPQLICILITAYVTPSSVLKTVLIGYIDTERI
ncbi:PREDICTED: threonylcarbamoyladenosine tRNA methylthiotransferase-like [Galeopterus variegatus]|uniref:Threonylcarbamoyladenosine tRNA methylthiotransferase-like n=1 Tax=Galeopterus variegatus TaxID=482537 RepID=A0ABM0QQN6_GALVR|nr:PREDICTED: threonylcarbamoyladenosine tRNA methylthiotransferase-like [Galeopterus variegatus]